MRIQSNLEGFSHQQTKDHKDSKPLVSQISDQIKKEFGPSSH